MANVRFITAAQNALRVTTGLLPILVNGNGAYAGAPTLLENSPFIMANAMNADRIASLWQMPNSVANEGSNVVWTVDLRTAKTISAAAVQGLIHARGSFIYGANPTAIQVECLPLAAYSALNSDWVTVATIALGTSKAKVRDHGATFTPTSARWWRFRFIGTTFSNGLSVASFVLATSVTDLGFLYARSTETVVTPKSIVEGYGREAFVTVTGGVSRRWSLAYDNTDAATKAVFDALNNEDVSFTFLHPDGSFHECITDGDVFTRDHVWAAPDRYQFVFPMRSLP